VASGRASRPGAAKPRARTRRELPSNTIWNLAAGFPNHVWSYNFMSGRTREGSGFRILNVVDEFTRRALACRVDRSVGATAFKRPSQ